jgi:hypothetical protein
LHRYFKHEGDGVMTLGKSLAQYGAVFVCLTILAVPVSAGVLNEHPDAYNDGLGPGPGGLWSTTTSFTDGGNLSGTVDWAVFAPGDFPFDLGGGWTPTAGQVSYVYQILVDGSHDVSSYTVPLVNPADNIGAFVDALAPITGNLPDGMTLTQPPAGSAYWNWEGGNAIGQGGSSSGLAFSSPYKPEETFSVVVNGGSFAVAVPVPTPSDEVIPEPGTLTSLAVGLGVVLLTGVTRWRKK